MNPRLRVWPASTSDHETVLNLLNERVHWLRKIGSDQWSTHERWGPELDASISERRTLILWDMGEHPDHDEPAAVGTITISKNGDPDFWTEAERQTPALYLAKLATKPAARGLGYGRMLLDHVMHLAHGHNLSSSEPAFHELRIDVWKTATSLHRYYAQLGWTYLRTVDHEGRHSGTLFMRPVTPMASSPLTTMSPWPSPPPAVHLGEQLNW